MASTSTSVLSTPSDHVQCHDLFLTRRPCVQCGAVETTDSKPEYGIDDHFERLTKCLAQNHRWLILMRGYSGSGKSTTARLVFDRVRALEKSVKVYSADDFFYDRRTNQYKWNSARLHLAHQQCQTNAETSMKRGVSVVIIDNTNIDVNHMRPYATAAVANAYEVYIMEPETSWKHNIKECAKRSSHGVPAEKMALWSNGFKKSFSLPALLGISVLKVPATVPGTAGGPINANLARTTPPVHSVSEPVMLPTILDEDSSSPSLEDWLPSAEASESHLDVTKSSDDGDGRNLEPKPPRKALSEQQQPQNSTGAESPKTGTGRRKARATPKGILGVKISPFLLNSSWKTNANTIVIAPDVASMPDISRCQIDSSSAKDSPTPRASSSAAGFSLLPAEQDVITYMSVGCQANELDIYGSCHMHLPDSRPDVSDHDVSSEVTSQKSYPPGWRPDSPMRRRTKCENLQVNLENQSYVGVRYELWCIANLFYKETLDDLIGLYKISENTQQLCQMLLELKSPVRAERHWRDFEPRDPTPHLESAILSASENIRPKSSLSNNQGYSIKSLPPKHGLNPNAPEFKSSTGFGANFNSSKDEPLATYGAPPPAVYNHLVMDSRTTDLSAQMHRALLAINAINLASMAPAQPYLTPVPSDDAATQETTKSAGTDDDEVVTVCLGSDLIDTIQQLNGVLTDKPTDLLTANEMRAAVPISLLKQLYHCWADKQAELAKDTLSSMDSADSSSMTATASRVADQRMLSVEEAFTEDPEYVRMLRQDERLARQEQERADAELARQLADEMHQQSGITAQAVRHSPQVRRLHQYWPGVDEGMLQSALEAHDHNMTECIESLRVAFGRENSQPTDAERKTYAHQIKARTDTTSTTVHRPPDHTFADYIGGGQESMENDKKRYERILERISQLDEARRQKLAQINQELSRKRFHVIDYYREEFNRLTNEIDELKSLANSLILDYRSHMHPDNELDLHGLQLDAAIVALKHKLVRYDRPPDMRDQGNPKELVVITGVGKHSPNRPVLLPAVRQYLTQKKYQFYARHPGVFVVTCK